MIRASPAETLACGSKPHRKKPTKPSRCFRSMEPRRCAVSVKSMLAAAKRRHLHGFVLVALCGCSWFTDFKEQPKIDPWDTPNDSTPPRGNPQGSVPVYGSAAPEFMYARNM